MSNCNKELIELLNSMYEYIEYGKKILKDSNINEEFKDGINAFIEGFVMIDSIIDRHSKKMKKLIEKESEYLSIGLEASVIKINDGFEYELEEYLKNIVEPFLKWENAILSNIKIDRNLINDIISELIQKGNFEEARKTINKYEGLILEDKDIYFMKSLIYIGEKKFYDAIDMLKKALMKDESNFDMLYKITYAYAKIEKYDMASFYYKKLHSFSTFKDELKKNLDIELGMKIINKEIKVLIGSPIHQKPNILKEFLISLKELNSYGLELGFYFIDDNEIKESSEILEKISLEDKNIIVEKSRFNDIYQCNSDSHNWNEKLVWKVAKFKDKIINYANENNYDYLFLVDSDLILRPDTLINLINSNKDIISEVFWTKWNKNSCELPQVWMKDFYTQYSQNRDEKLSEFESLVRTVDFIRELREPGIYEVGGLGACTLISRNAINEGVNFSEISNISFWGEDRHFCIRAKALGFPLYVDTRYPALHIYRESDIDKIVEYKNNEKYVRKKKISLVVSNLSGSNTYSLFKHIDEVIKNKYDIEIIQANYNSSEYIKKILSSDIVITTEGNYVYDYKFKGNSPIVIDLWHGFPMKAMGYSDKGELYKESIESNWKNVDYLTSYSHLFNELMSTCLNNDLSKYIITGSQRNDFLFYTNGRKNIEELFEEDFYDKKLIFYMPTYRYTPRGDREEGDKDRSNIFGFKEFDDDKFEEFLEENNYILFVKLHPAEENMYVDKIVANKNIRIITNNMLYEKIFDLYEIMNSADLLITDYSSIYFDMLLLDIPVIFTPVDLDNYGEDRGFLLAPYDEWTPGPKCIIQESLQTNIKELLVNPNKYGEERSQLLKKVHKYTDGNSCFRTWNIVDIIASNL